MQRGAGLLRLVHGFQQFVCVGGGGLAQIFVAVMHVRIANIHMVKMRMMMQMRMTMIRINTIIVFASRNPPMERGHR